MLTTLRALGVFLAQILHCLVQTMPDKRVSFTVIPRVFFDDKFYDFIKIQILHKFGQKGAYGMKLSKLKPKQAKIRGKTPNSV